MKTAGSTRRRAGRGLGRPAAFAAVLALAVVGMMIFWFTGRPADVVVYVALAQVYSEPILREFERQTGLRVVAKYDAEAVKTVGLVALLELEQSRPQADVFWNNEIIHTIRLKRGGCLAQYVSPAAAEVPPEMKDPAGYWTGFAARARIIIYNKNLISEEEAPQRVEDLLDWGKRATIARPLAGTTLTHAAVLWAKDPAGARGFFERVKSSDVLVGGGNATVRDRVARDDHAVGLTDTDDAYSAILPDPEREKKGWKPKPLGIIWPDQEEGESGVLLIPNTVSLIADCPHPEAGKRLIDFLLSKEVEAMLARARSRQIPLKKGVERPEGLPAIETIRIMPADFAKAADCLREVEEYLRNNGF